MKTRFLVASLIALAFAAISPPVRAQQFLSYGTQTLLSGGTVNVAAATTNSYAYNLDCKHQDSVGVLLSFTSVGTNSSAIVFRLKPSLDAVTSDNQGTSYDITVAANGTNTVTVCTNIAVGGIGFLMLTAVENPNASKALTNVTFSYSIKK